MVDHAFQRPRHSTAGPWPAPAPTIDVTEVLWKVIKEGAIAEKEIAEVLNGS